MADTVVSFLLDNCSQLIQQEVKLLAGVGGQIKLLQNHLQMMNAFLKASGRKRNEHEIGKMVVDQIRDVAYEAEDVIDTYIVNVTKQGRRSLLGKAAHIFDQTIMRHDLADKIKKINATVEQIYSNKERYDIGMLGESMRADLAAAAIARAESVHKRRREVEEDEVVSFDNYAAEVTKLLVEGDSSREVVSIIGMGGLGKTTLARKVYNDYRVKKYFDQCAWTYVSADFRAREVLLSLLWCLSSVSEETLRRNNKNTESGNAQDVELLKRMLRESLMGTTYLIVLDDIWNTSVWDEIKGAFPDDNIGSRILITSRENNVASYAKGKIPAYNLQPLTKEDSWKLFSKKVFGGEECPPGLELLGKEIVDGCKGLPLSIVILAGLLRSKEKSEREWEKFKGNVNWYLNQEETLVKDVLKLSYDNLPRELKPCFLYLGIYPEDFEIPVRQLIHLWTAEGFIRQTGNKSLEEVAEENLEALISRNLVQVVSKRTDGGVRTCRVHELLRDLCISESEVDKFLEVRTDINILQESRPRRLALHGSTTYYLSESPSDHSCTRSLLCFYTGKTNFHASHEKKILKEFKLIRVLHLGLGDLASQIDKLEKLIHLRYLKMDCRFAVLPESMCNLSNLETLDLRVSDYNKSLPKGFWKLKRLRHLYISGKAILPDLSGSDIKIMPNLLTLCFIALDRRNLLQLAKGRFPNLRKLGFRGPGSEKDLMQRLECLSHLNTLKMRYVDLPENARLPPNITKITLLSGGFLKERMSVLANLPNLRILKLSGVEIVSTTFELKCPSEGFQKLEVLQITSVSCKRWEVAQGGMPQLKCLVIKKCEDLTGLLNELASLTTLREVELLQCSREIVDKFQKLETKDVCKVTIDPPPGEEDDLYYDD